MADISCSTFGWLLQCMYSIQCTLAQARRTKSCYIDKSHFDSSYEIEFKMSQPQISGDFNLFNLCLIYIWRVSEPAKNLTEICLFSDFSFDTITFAPFV